MEKFDVVWCDSKHEARAVDLVRSLTPDELDERRRLRHRTRGYAVGLNMKIPDAEGYLKPGHEGSWIAADIWGIRALRLGKEIDGEKGKRLRDFELFELEVIEPGLVGGRYKGGLAKFLKRKEVQASAETERAVARTAAEEMAQREAGRYAERELAQVRWLRGAGHLVGVKKPGNLAQDELSDLAIFAALTGNEHLPDLDTFLDAVAPLPDVPDLSGISPFQLARENAVAAGVTRKEKTK